MLPSRIFFCPRCRNQMHSDFAALKLHCIRHGCEDVSIPFERVEATRLVEIQNGKVRYVSAVCVVDLGEDGMTVDGHKWEKIQL